jgi:hypothetical protein
MVLSLSSFIPSGQLFSGSVFDVIAEIFFAVLAHFLVTLEKNHVVDPLGELALDDKISVSPH